MKINSLVSLAVVLILLLLVDTEANPKARAEVNKDAILPQMTLEQIKEGKKRASEFVPVQEKQEESNPFSINAA